MLIVYVDGDACPVKEEIYRVTERFAMQVVVVANAFMRTPANERITLEVIKGFNGADDYIVEQCGIGDLVITADIPLAARALAKGAKVLDPRGKPFTEGSIGLTVGMRDLLADLRQTGEIMGGPPPMTAKDRSKFLMKLDETLHALKKLHPK